MQIPNIYQALAKRMREWERAFREYVGILCDDDIVIEAYLVGSRARGDHLPYSDYDIVVIVPEGLDRLEVAERLRRLRRRSFPLDLIVLYPNEVSDRLYAEMMGSAKRLCRRGG